MADYTDKEMLDYLQAQNEKGRLTGKCILRVSLNRRGWRLHETTRPGALNSVREAIAAHMDAEHKKGH